MSSKKVCFEIFHLDHFFKMINKKLINLFGPPHSGNVFFAPPPFLVFDGRGKSSHPPPGGEKLWCAA